MLRNSATKGDIMEQSFSQRMGLKPVKRVIQVNSIDTELRMSLWNNLFTAIEVLSNSNDKYKICREIWISYLNKSIDEAPKDWGIIIYKTYFFSCEWNEVFDFLEFTIKHCSNWVADELVKACNASLERELSAYRFLGGEFVQITSDQEIGEIEEALNTSKQFTQHLQRALELLADRQFPDYRNSIKESISAVEAMCKLITGGSKVTLGDALRQIESKLGVLHPALRNAFNSLYGYSSDAEGIRHGMLGESALDVEDAKFMLIACSAFINYLAAKVEKAGIQLSHE